MGYGRLAWPRTVAQMIQCLRSLVLQGWTAERAAKVTLCDKNDLLLSRAAVANEDIDPPGYMYAGDPTLSTQRP
jgi:hypothetical protein